MSELGKAYVQIVPSAQGISGSISSVLDPEAISAGKSAGTNIAGGIGSALKGAASVVAIGATAVTGALIKGTSDLAAYGDNIDKMSQKMGLSRQAYQEWDAVMQHSGTSMEAMKASMKTLANAAETNSKAFEQLGISEKQLKEMNQEQLFEATIAALQNVENETERTYLAGKTLGRGATELGALLNTSAEDTQAMRDRVRELGGVMSDEAVMAAAAFQDNMQDLKTAISGLGRGMLSELLPSMNSIISGFTSLIAGEEDAKEKLSAGFTDIVTNVIPSLLETAVNMIMSLGQAILDAVPKLIESGLQLFEKFKESLPTSDMLDKGFEIVTNLINGIIEKLPQFIETAGKLITDFATYIMNNLPTIMQKGAELLLSLVNGIVKNLPQIVTSVVKVIAQFIATIGQNLPKILEQGYKILGELIAGLIKAIPELVKSIPKIISSMVDTFKGYDWLEIGVNILQGIIDGMMGAISSIVEAAREAASAIYDGIKDFFSINSPSKKTMWIGKMIDSGLAEGISDNQDLIDDALDDINTDLASQLQVSANVGAYDNRQASGGIVVNMTINGAAGQDVEQLADYVQQKLMNALGRNEAVYA